MSVTSAALPVVTAALVLADGTVFCGTGLGASGERAGEVCFNTAMTGYQETISDPSYAGQIITFTTPHIGNTGINDDDFETLEGTIPVQGVVLRQVPTAPSSWRSRCSLGEWLARRGIAGIAGVDTRALTRHIRERGAQQGLLVHQPQGISDIPALQARAAALPGLAGKDLAVAATGNAQGASGWQQGVWQQVPAPARFRVVAIDYGIKHNILRCLVDAGCEVTVAPATATAEEILAHRPDGIFLSNGPGDPAATGTHAIPVLQKLMATGKPVFGICLGFQLMALALGARSGKLHQGHRGANHPVYDSTRGMVEITSQNHGFEILADSLPEDIEITHRSLFDGTLEGFRSKTRPLFAVQYHPEASPGPQDSHYLFRQFVALMEKHR